MSQLKAMYAHSRTHRDEVGHIPDVGTPPSLANSPTTPITPLIPGSIESNPPMRLHSPATESRIYVHSATCTAAYQDERCPFEFQMKCIYKTFFRMYTNLKLKLRNNKQFLICYGEVVDIKSHSNSGLPNEQRFIFGGAFRIGERSKDFFLIV